MLAQNLNQVLEKEQWKELEKEGITKEDVELVDLDMAFSPVTPYPNVRACEVIKTIGGNYIVQTEPVPITVTPNTLRVMRYRYLQFNRARVAQRKALNNMFKS